MKRVLFFLFLIHFSSSALAAQTISSYITARCHANRYGISPSRFKNTVKETLKASFLDPDSLVNIYKQRGLSRSIQYLLSSEEYYQALNECYGKNILKKNLFTASLIAEDITGRASGLAIGGGIYYLGGQLLAVISESYPTIGKILIASNIGVTFTRAAMILREHYKDASPEEKRQLELFLQQNANNSRVVRQRAIEVVEIELAKIDETLTHSTDEAYHTVLITKRHKLVESLELLKK